MIARKVVGAEAWIASLAIAAMTTFQAWGAPPDAPHLRKPTIADTVRANMYADNWFCLSINGELVPVDSIAFLPHNVIAVDVLPRYPMTIAVMAKDNAHPKQPFYDADFAGASFIWTADLKLDNTVIFRRVIDTPPDGKARPDFSRLNDVVPEGPPPGGGRGPGGSRGPDGRRPPPGRPR
jgi:hypothetical protein